MEDPNSQKSNKKKGTNPLDALKNYKMVREGKIKRSEGYQVCHTILFYKFL